MFNIFVSENLAVYEIIWKNMAEPDSPQTIMFVENMRLRALAEWVNSLAEERPISGAFAKLRKATVSFIMSVRPSVHMEHVVSHWADFR